MSTPRKIELPVAAHTCNSSTQEGAAGVQEFKVHFLYMRLGLSRATGEPVPKERKRAVCKEQVPKHGWLEKIQVSVKGSLQRC